MTNAAAAPRSAPRPYPVVSADTHMSVPAGFWDVLPEHLRPLAPHFEDRDGVPYLVVDGAPPLLSSLSKVDVDVLRSEVADEYLLERCHRQDPTRGLDHQVRKRQQLRDGVDAEVLYPNETMAIYASSNVEFQTVIARAYNDFLIGWTASYPHRYVPVGMLPLVDDVGSAVRELERIRALGMTTVLLPPAMPWLPYDRPEYEPLWAALVDLDVVLSFHVFAGATFLGADFADVRRLDLELLKKGRALVDHDDFSEGLQRTVIGMASGMSPIVNLTSAGVLERHPRLRFVVAEGEIGWLAWVLQAMDQMQHHRGHYMSRKLSLRASEYFKRQGWATFTDDVVGCRSLDIIGVENVMWSNDYPHDEGTYLESAMRIEANMGELSDEAQRRLLWANAADLYALDAGALLAERAAFDP